MTGDYESPVSLIITLLQALYWVLEIFLELFA
jgi:hypothetical protein